MEAIDFLVIEAGAEWAPGLARVGSSFVALAQEPKECADAFSSRIIGRLDAVLREGSRVRRVVIGADAEWRVETLRARFEVLRKLRAEDALHGNSVEVVLLERGSAEVVLSAAVNAA